MHGLLERFDLVSHTRVNYWMSVGFDTWDCL